MNREIIELKTFTKAVKKAKINPSIIDNLKKDLLENPEKGDIIKGTSGLRKIRVPIDGKGKRGGARVIYYYYVVNEIIYLSYLYKKADEININNNMKKYIVDYIKEIKEGKRNEDNG